MASKSMSRRRNSRLLVLLWYTLTFILLESSVSFSIVSQNPRKSSIIRRDATNTALEAKEQTTPSSTTESILESVHQEHNNEVSNGFEVWGRSSDFDSLDTKKKQWTDDDFHSRGVGIGNAGPHESMLQRGHEIFETLHPVMTRNECEKLITEARQVIADGLEREGSFRNDGGSAAQPTNSQLGEARLSQMPRAREWLRQALHERFFPLLESRFGVPANELTLNDALIIGYGYFGQMSRSQPVHRDSDLLSLNVALSPIDSYDENGGGTYFDALPHESSVIKTQQGYVLCHSGGVQHAGRGIASGERWILVLFCISEKEPQLARRCHAKGLIQRQEGNLEQAKATFHAGLSVAPTDHLLLASLGSVLMTQGDERQARYLLAASANSYRHDQKANIGLGRMMLSNGRPRAALRRFDAVLDYLQDYDLKPNTWMPLKAHGWDARLYGSHAVIQCVQEAKRLGATFDSTLYLKRAIERLNVALSAVPGDGRILSMLSQANELLAEEDNAGGVDR